MVYDDVLFSVYNELFFTQICNPSGGVTMESRSGKPRTEACTSTWLRCRSGLVRSCYEAAIRLTIHLLRASSDEFGAYDGVNFTPKSASG